MRKKERKNSVYVVHLTDAWRSDEECWSYEYTLRDHGILSRPIIKAK